MTLVYNDLKAADYEPRPLAPRPRPLVLPTSARRREFTGRFLCVTVRSSSDEPVRRWGRLVRLIEGMPVVGRHSTQTNPWPVWKNHGGTIAGVLGTLPLAADGSLYVEVPADRLLHLQVLDSDRWVVGNQLTWTYARPGETRSCAGCHERPDTTPRLETAPTGATPRASPASAHRRRRVPLSSKGVAQGQSPGSRRGAHEDRPRHQSPGPLRTCAARWVNRNSYRDTLAWEGYIERAASLPRPCLGLQPAVETGRRRAKVRSPC